MAAMMATAAAPFISADALRDRRVSEDRQRVESAWYYAKKAVAMFPGVRRAVSPAFLRPYYDKWERELSAPRIALNSAILSGFHAWLPGRTRKIAARYGLDEDWAREAERRARKFVIDPIELAIFHVERDEDLDTCLRSFEWARMHKLLVPQYWTPDCRVAHKTDFYLHAMRHGLPIPTLRAIVQDGAVDLLQPVDVAKLVCKPENGQGGRAVFIVEVPETVRGDGAALAAMLAADPRLAKGDWVVQDHIEVHPALRALGMNALPTVRIITMPNERGEIEIVVNYLRFASDPKSEVDNFAAGGLMGLIDRDTGKLQYGVIMRDVINYTAHPTTGAPIEGVEIPFWRETCELVLRAHAEGFADYRMVGWDIGVTESGPTIIEGNAKPCPRGAQQVHRHGLGNDRFGQLIAWHLKQVGAA